MRRNSKHSEQWKREGGQEAHPPNFLEILKNDGTDTVPTPDDAEGILRDGASQAPAVAFPISWGARACVDCWTSWKRQKLACLADGGGAGIGHARLGR